MQGGSDSDPPPTNITSIPLLPACRAPRSPRAGCAPGRGRQVVCGASPARLARAPRFPGVTCESPPATSSALFLFTFPARRQPAALLSAGTPQRGHGRAQMAPGTPHPRRAGGRTVLLPGRSPTSLHPAGGMLQLGRLRSPSLIPPDRDSDPRHKPGPALPWLPPESPLPRPAGSPGGAFR